MAEYTRRLQILLSEEQHDFLQQLSERRRTSVGELVRRAVEEVYRPASSLSELQAIDRLRRRSFMEESTS